MTVTLERKLPWWPSAIVIVAIAGIAATILAYMTTERRTAGAAPTAPPATDPPAKEGAVKEASAKDNKIHVPLFVDPALVRPTPRFRFTFDPPEALGALRQEEKI